MTKTTVVGDVLYGEVRYLVHLVEGVVRQSCLLCDKPITKKELAVLLTMRGGSRLKGSIAHISCAKRDWHTVYALIIENVDRYPQHRTKLVFEAAS